MNERVRAGAGFLKSTFEELAVLEEVVSDVDDNFPELDLVEIDRVVR